VAIRTFHREEITRFLQKQYSCQGWDLTLPAGTGHETYIARLDQLALFIKLGVEIKRYRVAAAMELTPPVLTSGHLEDGTSLIIQPFITGIRPSRKEYHQHIEEFANAITRLHGCLELQQLLSGVASDTFSEAGLRSLEAIRSKWELYRPLVPGEAPFVDEKMEYIKVQIDNFKGSGLVASHNDICNYNWLLSKEGQLFLLDLDAMSLDDPALDIGATLWWYYPPNLHPKFLEITGHLGDPEISNRMQVRMAMHCLNIELPRSNSFDTFDPDKFGDYLVDFKAVLAGEENPQGYEV